jgi:hypothetical protein
MSFARGSSSPRAIPAKTSIASPASAMFTYSELASSVSLAMYSNISP